MARIPMTNGFVLIPEGTYVFRIYDATYDEEFGKIEIKLVTAKGQTHIERFTIKDQNDEFNEKALNAFSYFAKTALNDFDVEDVDPEELIDCYIRAEVVHSEVPSNKDPNKTRTFANLGDKEAADGFDEEPCERALTLSRATAAKSNEGKKGGKAATPKSKTEKPAAKKGLDLDALLG